MFFFFPFSFSASNVHNTKPKARSSCVLAPGACWRSGCKTQETRRWVENSPERKHTNQESWVKVMRSVARADRKLQRQKALLTHPKPLNPRRWPLGARKCNNVGISSRRADWRRYYTAGRLPRWGDTVSDGSGCSSIHQVQRYYVF